MDITKLILIIVLCVAVGYFWPKIPAPYNWVIAAIACVIALLGLAQLFGLGSFFH